MNHDPTHTEEEAAVGGGAAAVADVAVPGPTLGPIHFDLHLGQRLKILVGGWCYSNSIVAIVESEVAAEYWKNCQKEATHLPPNQYDHRFLQTLHYLCPLLLLPLLTHEQRVHDVPQTMNEEHLPHDYLSADRQVAKKLHPQHPVAKEVTAVTGGGVRRSFLRFDLSLPLTAYAIAWATLSAASLFESSLHWPVSGHCLRNLPGGSIE